MPQIGHFFWNELNAIDPHTAMQFYKNLVGWTFEPTPTDDGGPYWMAKWDDVPVAGIIPHVGGDSAPETDFWTPYLAVENVDDLTQKAVDAGSRIIRPLWDVPFVGRRVILKEPGGALVAWITPLKQ